MGVVLAVRAGEDGDQRLRACDLDGGRGALFRFIGKALDRAGILRLRRVDRFEHGIVQGQQLRNARLVIADGDRLLRRRDADADGVGNFLGELGDDRAGHGPVPVESGRSRGKADLVAERHLHHRLGKAVFNGPGACGLARAGKRGKAFPRGGLLLRRAAVEEINAVTGGLEVSRHKLARAHRCNGERDERRRDVVV